MAAHYSAGETKVRPGIYFRETNGSGTELISARNGVAAAAFKANWGPRGGGGASYRRSPLLG